MRKEDESQEGVTAEEMFTSLSNVVKKNGSMTKRHSAVLQAEKKAVLDKSSEPSRTPAESYSRFSAEQLQCNFSYPFFSSLPLVMVKVTVTLRSSCWKMGHLSLKCFTPTLKNTLPHLMLVSSQYLHTSWTWNTDSVLQ